MVSQDSMLVTLVHLVDRLPMPTLHRNGDAGTRKSIRIECS